ncbi:flagellar assembly peptidoglycan hydrolase FlgJ [Pseudomonas sp. MWU13-2100]|uniref:flagellar assembly peptidoglycan hydrolase FlgJ n=1 Tax=Pseudomonas sp. MWU13-2100 TaxID=2935075 RepID=UPI00200C87A1|nr:flagellar assembly peptidoglycan hydrolase FlgJ [Pseudomonas sp. MWU13-2100]
MVDMRKSGLTGTSDSGAYSDLNRLNSLKVGNRDSAGNIRKVAQEFESLFVGEMLKSARAATDVMAQDNPLNTPATKQYQEMYDHQLAVTMSRQGGGIGLADVLVRQMTKNKPTRPADGGLKVGPPAGTLATETPVQTPIGAGTTTAATAASPFARSNGQRPLWASRVASPIHNSDGSLRNDMAKLNERRLSLPSKLTDRLVAGLVPSADGSLATVNTQAVPARNSAASDSVLQGQAARSLSGVSTTNMRIYGRAVAQPPLAPAKRAFSSPDEFVATMLPMAEQAARRIGVDPRYLVAQAALETGWGKSVMRQQDGSSSHNLFGIKAGSSWQGPQARAITSEFKNGQMVKETADFRSYASYQDSFHDLVTMLQSNNRYQDVLKSADKPEQFVRELQKAGYATDPDYASKISQIAKQMKSYQNYAAAGASTNL